MNVDDGEPRKKWTVHRIMHVAHKVMCDVKCFGKPPCTDKLLLLFLDI